MKSYYSIIGYVLFILGFLSIVLGLLGIKLTIIAWIDRFPTIIALVIKLGMVIGGLILMYVTRIDHSEYEPK